MSEKHKICLLGAASVGKTSLVRRYVRSIFSDEYQTTVGVTIEKKEVQQRGRDVELVIWDLSGEDEFQTVRLSYLAGASGYLLVIDGTRRATVETARVLHDAVLDEVGELPFVILLNKGDLLEQWEVAMQGTDPLVRASRRVIRTSAKTGAGVEAAFRTLVDACIENGARQ